MTLSQVSQSKLDNDLLLPNANTIFSSDSIVSMKRKKNDETTSKDLLWYSEFAVLFFDIIVKETHVLIQTTTKVLTCFV